MAFLDVVHRVLSECKQELSSSKVAFTSHVTCNSGSSSGICKGSSNRTFVLDGRTCQIHLILKKGQDACIEKTLFLTPQPVVFPSSLALSPCGSYLALAADTSAHVVDLVKLEPVIQSQQKKIVAKLFTAYDSLSGDCNQLSQLVRLRWHPSIKGLLVLLTEDGLLQFVQCEKSSAGNFLIEPQLSVSVLQNRELASSRHDKENTARSRNSVKLNLSLAMGVVCTDFDIGSPIFSSENSPPLNVSLISPVYIVCENGDIIMVSSSPGSPAQAQVRVVRILPSSEDYYTYDFDALLCLRSEESSSGRPDVLCFANRVGRIFHGIVLHVPPSVLLHSANKPQGRSVPILYLIDVANLQLSLLSGSDDASISDDQPKLSKLSLLSAPECTRSRHSPHYYLCAHDFGIHFISLPWVGLLKSLCSLDSDEKSSNKSDIIRRLRNLTCTTEHLLLTQSPCQAPEAQNDSTVSFRRPILGLLPQCSSDDSINSEHRKTLLVLFSTKPSVVEIALPFNHLRPRTTLLTDTEFSEPTRSNLNLSPTSTSNTLKESNFVRSCWNILSSGDTSRLPIISTSDTADESSESNVIRFFVKATNVLRTTRLSRLNTLLSALNQFAEHVEEQLAAQYEEITCLANERNQIHNTSIALTDRHSQILERQENLNHRLSELARRIYSIEVGLTDSELAMREEVQTLRDRLKSCLLGWFENIRLQYDHLVSRLDRAERYSITENSLKKNRKTSELENLTQPEVLAVTDALKEEGSELDALIKAVENLNSLSIN